MATGDPDLVIRVAANIEALKKDMAAAAATLKEIKDAANDTAEATHGLAGMFDQLGAGMAAHVLEGALLRDALREIISIGKEAFTQAAAFDDLSRATGISIQSIQALSYVGQEFGVSTEQMGRAVEQLSSKLAGGDANATKAVQMLGLSVADLIAAGPEEAFLQIAEATGRVENPMMKASLASDEFGGKLAKILLPALGELRQKMDEASKSGALMSAATVKAAHDFEVGWAHAVTTTEANIATFLVWLGEHLKRGRSDNTPDPIVIDIVLPNDKVEQVLSDVNLLQNRLTALRAEAIVPLTDAQKANILELEHYGESQKDIAQLVGTTVIAVHQFEAAHKAAEAELKKFQTAVDDVNTAGVGWRGTLAGIDGAILDNMRDLTAAGVSIKTLETYYGLTATQGKAFTDMLKAESEALKVELLQRVELEKVTDEYYKAVNAASHDTVGRQIADAYLSADARIAAMEKTKSYSVAAEMLIWAAADQTANNIIQKTLESDVHTHAHFLKLADDAQIAYDFATAHADQYTADWIQKLANTAIAAQQTADSWGQSFDGALAPVAGKLAALQTAMTTLTMKPSVTSAELDKVGAEPGSMLGFSVGQMVMSGMTAMTALAPRPIQMRAAGGPVSAGDDYMVGEHGPEHFTSDRAGSITPNGGGDQYNTFHLYGTPESLVQQVKDALARTMKAGRKYT